MVVFTSQLPWHVAVALFGVGSWLSVNALYVELPILVDIVPEGWNFATYLVLIVQLSCLIPLVYGLLKSRLQRLGTAAINSLIVGMILLTAAGLLLAAKTYRTKDVVFGEHHSLWLMIAALVLSIPCTTSDLLYLPYTNKFEDAHFVTSYFVGMGASALIPSLLSIAQGNADNAEKKFSVEAFLYVMVAVLGGSLIAFLVIARRVQTYRRFELPKLENSADNSTATISAEQLTSLERVRTYASSGSITVAANASSDNFRTRSLLVISLLLGGIQNSVLPTVLPFAAHPYGSDVYRTANTLFVLANPLFCSLQFLISVRRTSILIAWCLACLLFTGGIAALSVVSVSNHAVAVPLLYTLITLASGLIAWERAAAAKALRESTVPEALFWCGAATQSGSFFSALGLFALTQKTHIFNGT